MKKMLMRSLVLAGLLSILPGCRDFIYNQANGRISNPPDDYLPMPNDPATASRFPL